MEIRVTESSIFSQRVAIGNVDYKNEKGAQGVRAHSWITALILNILGMGNKIVQLEDNNHKTYYINRNSLNKWLAANGQSMIVSTNSDDFVKSIKVVLNNHVGIVLTKHKEKFVNELRTRLGGYSFNSGDQVFLVSTDLKECLTYLDKLNNLERNYPTTETHKTDLREEYVTKTVDHAILAFKSGPTVWLYTTGRKFSELVEDFVKRISNDGQEGSN